MSKYTVAGGKVFDEQGAVVGRVGQDGKTIMNLEVVTADLESVPEPVTVTKTAGEGVSSVLGSSVSADGLKIGVPAFVVGPFSFAGGSITALPNGTWYIGVELSSKQVRTLPRLGHRGWVPVAKITTNATEVTEIIQIKPELPVCRIPRTMAKVLAGETINVIIMGSSLTASAGDNGTWPGMVFGQGSILSYKVPTTCNTRYTGVGGSPNKYQLAQLGLASSHTGYGFPDTGYPGTISAKTPPNGRSSMFTGVDLVVIGCLANGGTYWLENIEPIIRKLRQRGLEVIVVTDNPQGPSLNYDTMTAAALYAQAPEVFRVGELYGIEIADTAAYVFESYIRNNGTGIYSTGDTIHMQVGAPNGPASVAVANGHEAWARAVRSIFSIDAKLSSVGDPAHYVSDFSTSIAGWSIWNNVNQPQTLVKSNNTMLLTKINGTDGQWGAQYDLGKTYKAGAVVTVKGQLHGSAGRVQCGIVNGSWASDSFSVEGSFEVTLVLGREASYVLLLATPDSATAGSTVEVTSIEITATDAAAPVLTNTTPNRAVESRPLPPIRIVTDMKTPADTFVILPADETYYTGPQSFKGSLAAHPWGGGSFARSFYPDLSTTSDLLVLGPGKRAAMGGECVVGFSIVHYREIADGPCTVDVYINDAKLKSIQIATVPFSNEWWFDIMTPAEINATGPEGGSNTIDLRVVSGTLKIAALVALTADVDYVAPEDITFNGTGWLPKEDSRSSLPGRPTDTLNDRAIVRCTGRRLMWILSGNPGSKLVDVWSGNKLMQNVTIDGNYHVKKTKALYGPDQQHVVRCAVANASGSQANGHALHVGGAIIINDR